MIKLKDSMATYNLIIHRVLEQTVPFNGLILPVAGRIRKFCFPGKTHGGSLCREKQTPWSGTQFVSMRNRYQRRTVAVKIAEDLLNALCT